MYSSVANLASAQELQRSLLQASAGVLPPQPMPQMAAMPTDLSALILAARLREERQQKLELARLQQLLIQRLQAEQLQQLQQQQQQAMQLARLARLARLQASQVAPSTAPAPGLALSAPPPPPGLSKDAILQLGLSKDAILRAGLSEDSTSCSGDSSPQRATELGSGSDGSDHGGASTRPPPAAAPATAAESQETAQPTVRMRTLVVGKFPRGTSDRALGDAFGTIVGRSNVNFCRIVRGKSGRSRCYAFVEFADLDATEAALEACNKGDLILLDEEDTPWQVTANRARRARAAPPKSGAQAAPAEQCESDALMMRL